MKALLRLEPSVTPLDSERHRQLGRAAVAALHDELSLDPKPGLVSFVDSGSHDDMDARTFMRSLFSLRHAFVAAARLGASHAPFAALERWGLAAEARMLAATGGINTHRGAIYLLGLLCAAAGALGDRRASPEAIRSMLMDRWGTALAARARRPRATHGARAVAQLGLRGAGDEAALGFPVLFEHVWPALQAAQAAGWTSRRVRLQALYAAMARLDDTTLAHRGGLAGLRDAQNEARGFLARGGAGQAQAIEQAQALHAEFKRRRLSPGGAADMLAAACWLGRITRQTEPA